MHMVLGLTLLCLFTAGLVMSYAGFDRKNFFLFYIGVLIAGASGLVLVFH